MSSGKYRKEHNCLNCGHHVEKHYCSQCGQPNTELKESFWAFLSHSIAHYFHFDNKFFKTLKPLLFKPGFTTLEYLEGKRARYINPINLYIFVSVVYFLIMGFINTHDKHTATLGYHEQQEELPVNHLNDKNLGIRERLANDITGALKNEHIKKHFKTLNYGEQEVFLNDLKSKNDTSAEGQYLVKSLEKQHLFKQDSTYKAYLKRQQTLPANERDNVFNRFLKKRSIEFSRYGEAIQEKLEHNKPKQYFLFMPLMALFVMLNFRKNHFYYLDHLIFTIHGMTAFFLVQILTKPIGHLIFGEDTWASIALNWIVFAWVLWYMYVGLRTFYQRKVSTTIWRMIWIILLYLISLSLSESILRNIIYYTTV